MYMSTRVYYREFFKELKLSKRKKKNAKFKIIDIYNNMIPDSEVPPM